jgi:hypothetical protein
MIEPSGHFFTLVRSFRFPRGDSKTFMRRGNQQFIIEQELGEDFPEG